MCISLRASTLSDVAHATFALCLVYEVSHTCICGLCLQVFPLGPQGWTLTETFTAGEWGGNRPHLSIDVWNVHHQLFKSIMLWGSREFVWNITFQYFNQVNGCNEQCVFWLQTQKWLYPMWHSMPCCHWGDDRATVCTEGMVTASNSLLYAVLVAYYMYT